MEGRRRFEYGRIPCDGCHSGGVLLIGEIFYEDLDGILCSWSGSIMQVEETSAGAYAECSHCWKDGSLWTSMQPKTLLRLRTSTIKHFLFRHISLLKFLGLSTELLILPLDALLLLALSFGKEPCWPSRMCINLSIAPVHLPKNHEVKKIEFAPFCALPPPAIRRRPEPRSCVLP